MKFVVFGLSVSSSWGNGHATLWRGLARALHRRGHRLVFFERDQPYYASHRDLTETPGLEVVLYREFQDALDRVKRELCDADVKMVTSFCHDGAEASNWVLDSRVGTTCFYDLDTPVTLFALRRGEAVSYLPKYGLSPFDIVLSYTGGRALFELENVLGARRAVALYGSVDPDVHRPCPAKDDLRADLSYLGTYAADRQAALEELLLKPAACLPDMRFILAGAQYPADFPWRANLYFVNHLPPTEHAAFYGSSRLTLNVTRDPMAALGYCPSPRFFEAAACGAPLVSDVWDGIGEFFEPNTQLLLVRGYTDVVAALKRDHRELAAIGRRARERVLDEHTADVRAIELERLISEAGHESASPKLNQGAI